MTIADVLNSWSELGVFDYAIPFLLLFAVVFAILRKSKILSGEDAKNYAIEAIVSVAVALLALQMDIVSEFFAVIFPRFGIGLSIFLVLLIMIGFFFPKVGDNKTSWIGWVVGIGVVLWSLSEWDAWGNYNGIGGWFSEYIWALIVLGIIIGVIFWAASGKGEKPKEGK